MMEGNKNKSRALFVFGAPCSGKTTFSKKFADKFGLMFLDLDTFALENNFSRKNILAVIKLISQTKQNLVLEGGINTEKERREIKKILRAAGYQISVIWIQTDMATVRARLKTKHKGVAKAKEIYNTAVEEFEAPSETERPIILSGKHTFETQAKHVIAGLAEI